MNSSSLTEKQQSLLQAQLAPGEQVIAVYTQSMAVRLKLLTGTLLSTLVTVVFFVFIFGGSFFNFGQGIAGGDPIFTIFSLFFLLILIVSVGASILSAILTFTRGGPCYAVTGQRALAIDPGLRSQIYSFGVLDLITLHKRQDANGAGDLILRHDVVRSGRHSRTVERGFVGLENVRAAEDSLMQILGMQPSGFSASSFSSMMGDIAQEHAERLRQELRPGETLRWSGQPDRMRFALQRSWMSVLGGLFLLGMVGFAISLAPILEMDKAPEVIWYISGIMLVIIVMFCIGLLLRPVKAYIEAGRTLYAVTEKRLLVMDAGRGMQVTSFFKGALLNVQAKERQDGSGDIRRIQFFDKRTDLLGVDQVQRVVNVIREMS